MAPAPLSPDSAKCTFETELPYGLGSTNPCPTAVHMEPYCSSRGRSAPYLTTGKPPELYKPGRPSSWRDTERYSVRDTDLYVSARNISSLPLQTTTPFAHQKAKACQFSAGPTYQPFRPPTLIKRPSYLFSDESDPRRSLQTTICLADRLSGSFFERKHAHWRHCHQPPSTRGHLPWHGWTGLVGNMNGGGWCLGGIKTSRYGCARDTLRRTRGELARVVVSGNNRRGYAANSMSLIAPRSPRGLWAPVAYQNRWLVWNEHCSDYA
ncbi:hypothetical protein FPOAC1_003459 [Fusarium poae]|uniref:hypothetical protein n=1 Tax=Fusarium poae TaxID=36050 RepID=UPI001CE93281|nr:hypothetical protein FPOAC1_003459 [Fusarium poae]KAG8677441.1 hypothetical protein FPOAC1_003459 [Fusarium poae]